ncbi:hypothetical protein LXL04_007329 [Taraxacum kok-saghyz]
MKTTIFAGLFLAGIILIPEPVASQNNNAYRPGIATNDFFYGIMAKSANDCPGRRFYTRVAFLRVIRDYPQFARSGSLDDSKREIAAFFAHVTHETGHFCYIEEIDGRSKNYCDWGNREYPCAPNKGYYGRGPLQISWNYNYGSAGRSLGFDGLGNPDAVANDPMISFKTALWFWMGNVHSDFASGKGFGATIRAINGGECNGGNGDAVRSRVNYYTDYCRQFGVSTGGNHFKVITINKRWVKLVSVSSRHTYLDLNERFRCTLHEMSVVVS